MRPGAGMVLGVEMVIPRGNEPRFGKTLDVIVLASPGGRERAAEQYRALFNIGTAGGSDRADGLAGEHR